MTQPTLFIKPARSGIVRFPNDPSRTLADNGEEVPCTPYWTRRLADGSVVAAKRPAQTKEK